uniref:Uncharacterized protein n=1 Tax=viral metagenome TaxID=1070528 RepID=A0A6M3JUF9_9ZZZZ
MAFTTDDVLDRTKRKCGLLDQTKYDTELLQWMDDFHAIMDTELALIGLGWNETTTDINVVANQDTYALTPSYYVKYLHYKSGDNYNLVTFDPNILSDSYNPTNPESSYVSRWAFRGNNIILRGVPDADITAGLRATIYPDASDFSAAATVNEISIVRLLYVDYLTLQYKDLSGDPSPQASWAKHQQLLRSFIVLAHKRYKGMRLLEPNGYGRSG